MLVIYKNFEVVIFKQVEIYFVSVVANGHHECPLRVEQIYLFLERQFLIIKPADHILNITVKKSDVNLDYDPTFDLRLNQHLRLQIKLPWLTLQSF